MLARRCEHVSIVRTQNDANMLAPAKLKTNMHPWRLCWHDLRSAAHDLRTVATILSDSGETGWGEGRNQVDMLGLGAQELAPAF